ncbi:hypothetical protein BD408DRAFT_444373 [Parasitella parasitica]|nr:hypothetical protein BD408DRAFT_444373 [Parasitella parasitica]
MIIRIKPILLLGIMGSFVTIAFIYQILKPSLQQVSTRYLDSTEITNYTLLESLFSVSSYYHSVTEPESQDTHIIPTLKDLEEFDLDKLKTRFMIPMPSNISTTVIFKYDSFQLASIQLDFLLCQSMPPTVVYIVCSKKDRHTVIDLIQEKEEKFHIANVIRPSATAKDEKSAWFTGLGHYDINTDFVVLLDNNQVLPSSKYVEFIVRLLHSSTFVNTLVGTESRHCQQTNKAKYVKLLQDVWVLKREWFLTLLLSSSPSNAISSDLYSALQIPSVLIPSDDLLTGNTNRRVNLSECVDGPSVWEREDSVAFYTENQPSSALEKLVCQFASQHQAVYMITNAAQVKSPACLLQKPNVNHYSVSSKEEFAVIVNQIQARIVMHQEKNNRMLDAASIKDTTLIALPDLEHHSDMRWLSTLSIESLKEWNTPSVKLIVTTSGRNKSSQVERIFNSIKNADYLGDQVDISILMDGKSDELTTKLVDNLQWDIGDKQVRRRISSVHPMQIFAEAWYPSSDHEYAVILDDRVELSNAYYIWIKYSLLKYRYSTTTNKHTFGISLYSPRIVDTDPSGRRPLLSPPTRNSHNDASPYLMQAPCSSGALYFPQHWREFHDYITARLADQAIVKRGSGNKHLLKDSLLTISRTNRWINSWRKYFDEMAYMRGYVMLYPSVHTSYSTLHINLNKKLRKMYPFAEKLYNVPLSRTLPSSLPDAHDLPVLDLHGKSSDMATLGSRGRRLQREFSACKPTGKIHDYDASDMLCSFNRLIQIPIEESIDTISIKSVSLYT